MPSGARRTLTTNPAHNLVKRLICSSRSGELAKGQAGPEAEVMTSVRELQAEANEVADSLSDNVGLWWPLARMCKWTGLASTSANLNCCANIQNCTVGM